MDGYPNSEEEFELMYGDELDLLKEREEELLHVAGPKSRRSLDFNSATEPQPSTSRSPPHNSTQQPSTSTSHHHSSQNVFENSFDRDFQSLEPDPSRKRNLDSLFGDINDILNEEQLQLQNPKRPKTESEQLADDLLLIERIVTERERVKLKQTQSLFGFGSSTRNKQTDEEFVKYNLSFRVPKYPFMFVTQLDGNRVYVRMHSEQYETEDMERIVKDHGFSGLLTGSKSQQLWNEANEIINKRLETVTNQNTNTNELMEVDEIGTDMGKLWTDLYKPRKYIELLSDETINRSLLKWLKLWDRIVFHRRKPNKKQPNEVDDGLDETGRPKYKIALLCGPPGLGKTTLAHMVAKHCGYKIIEINASDDRSVETFKTVLKNGTEMKSVIGIDSKPNCLIFDEIDGAPATSIDFLIKYLTKQKTQIKRPIICICNDVYVPALRPLRSIAFVLNVPPVTVERLSGRLLEIANEQNIRTDFSAMLSLAKKSGGDIRTCLSVLNFHKLKRKPVTYSDIEKSDVIGLKDVRKNLFQIWNEVFQMKRSVSMVERAKNVLKTVGNSSGDFDRLVLGVYENFTKLKQKGATVFQTICLAEEWFSAIDCFHNYMLETQNYTLYSYVPYGFVAWHFTFANYVPKKLVFPTLAYEFNMKQLKVKSIAEEILNGLSTSIRPFNTQESLILDTVPMLSNILVPTLRELNIALYAPNEKILINHVVDVMVDYNLTYLQEKNLEGNYVYKMEPCIDDVITYPGVNGEKKLLSYTSKQIIAREIEVKKMKCIEARMKRSGNLVEEKKVVEVEKKKADVREVQTQENFSPNLPKIKSKVFFKTKDTIAKNFFERAIIKPKPDPNSEKLNAMCRSQIWFHFNAGYNNAVKRKIKLKDLLL